MLSFEWELVSYIRPVCSKREISALSQYGKFGASAKIIECEVVGGSLLPSGQILISAVRGESLTFYVIVATL